jgi:hypothetical protein
MNAVYAVVLPLVALADKGPEPKDVKAGWLAFGIFLLLVAATVALCFNFVKQLRKAQAAKDAGAYGDAPAPPDATTDSEQE